MNELTATIINKAKSKKDVINLIQHKKLLKNKITKILQFKKGSSSQLSEKTNQTLDKILKQWKDKKEHQ